MSPMSLHGNIFPLISGERLRYNASGRGGGLKQPSPDIKEKTLHLNLIQAPNSAKVL